MAGESNFLEEMGQQLQPYEVMEIKYLLKDILPRKLQVFGVFQKNFLKSLP